MKIICDACGARYSISDSKLKDKNKVYKVTCRACQNKIIINLKDDVKDEPEKVEGGNEGGDFDQAATKVFDYDQYTATGDGREEIGSEPEEDGDGAWYVVINGEQTGPLSAADIAAKYVVGEVNENSYVWKEGFADWQHLQAVEPVYKKCLEVTSGASYAFGRGALQPFAGLGMHYSATRPGATQAAIAE